MTAAPPRPKRTIHVGQVQARGYFFPYSLLSLTQARERVLTCWRPNTRVYEFSQGMVVEWPDSEGLDTRNAIGAPLVEIGGVFSAAPLTKEELSGLAAPPGSFVVMKEGSAEVLVPSKAWEIDPSRWFEWDSIPLLQPIIQAVALTEVRDGRTAAEPDNRILLEAPPADANLQAMAEALRKWRDGSPGGGSPGGGSPGGGAPRAGSPAGKGISWLFRLGMALTFLVDWIRKRPAKGSAPSQTARSTRKRLTRWTIAWRSLVHRWLLRSQLGQFLLKEQSRYVEDFLEAFEQGDFDRALRRAIPLGSGEAGEEKPPQFGAPTPRQDLAIRPAEVAAQGTINFEADFFGSLGRVYRRAFEQLEAAGRIQEAAFVLAELLRAHEEAVSFLERHGQLQLAAEMAEARHLPPDRAVRLWFLAGERERATLLARRTGAFEDAVLRLERDPKRQTEADALRLLWANHRAHSGDLIGAVQVAWKLPAARNLLLAWLDLLRNIGGEATALGLAYRAALESRSPADIPPEDPLFVDLEALILDPAELPARLNCARNLLNLPPNPALRMVARGLARRLLTDAPDLLGTADRALIPSLVQLTQDAALRADLPNYPTAEAIRLPQATDPASAGQPGTIKINAFERGIGRIWDAALLPGGRVALALGERGIRVLSRAGKTLFHLEAPATHLVASDHGDRLIALSHQGAFFRLTRVDLLRRKAEAWADTPLEGFAKTFDGSTWMVVRNGQILALDCLAVGLESLERSCTLGREAEIIDLARGDRDLCLAVRQGDAGETEIWRFELPNLVLRNRKKILGTEDMVFARVEPGGGSLVTYFPGPGSGSQYFPAAGTPQSLQEHEFLDLPITLSSRWLVSGHLTETAEPGVRSGAVLTLREVGASLGIALRVELEEATFPCARIQGDLLVLGDDLGRVVGINLPQASLSFFHRVG